MTKDINTKAKNRVVVCPTCNAEIEVRSAFAHMTLTRHMKEHKSE